MLDNHTKYTSRATWPESQGPELNKKPHLPSLVLGSLISESVWPGCQLPRQCYPQCCWHLVFPLPSSLLISWHSKRSWVRCLSASFYKLTVPGRSEQREWVWKHSSWCSFKDSNLRDPTSHEPIVQHSTVVSKRVWYIVIDVRLHHQEVY